MPGILLATVDEDHDPLTLLLVDGAAHGTVDFGGDGSFTYTPDADFAGDDHFTYRASDGVDVSAVQTVTIHVLTLPVGAEDEYATSINTPLSVDAATGVLDNDTDPEGDLLTAEFVPGVGPFNGTLDLKADGSFTYTPNAGFLGLDFFDYRPNDGRRLGAPVEVTIIVGSAPVGVPDTYATNHNTTLTVDAASGVLANDVDPNGAPLTALGTFSGPEQGNVTGFGSDGSFTYVPKTGFSGTVHFAYLPQSDGFSGELTTVTITVGAAVNTPPFAADDSFTVAQESALIVDAPGLLANDGDDDGDPINVSDNTKPANGTLIGPLTDGSFTYTPFAGFVGTDSFTYAVFDGSEDSDVATVTIQVTPVNHPPVTSDKEFKTVVDRPLTVKAPGVIFGAVDQEGDPLTARLVGATTHGTLQFSDDGGFTYEPDAGFAGDDSFTFQAFDGTDVSATHTAVIHILTTATGIDDSYKTDVDVPLAVDAADGVLVNDLDPEGDTLTASLGFSPDHGTVDLQQDGSFVYTPDAGFEGKDSFSYSPTDGTATGAVAFVTIIVGRAPVGVPDAYTTTEDTPLTVDAAAGVLANDTDFEGDTLTALKQTNPQQGSLQAFAPDGSFTFAPEPGFTGAVSFRYRVQDPVFDGGVVEVTISVEPNDDGSPTPPTTPDPNEEPTSTPTPEPTETGEPDPADEPTETPTATPTSEPTEEPTEEPTTPPNGTPTPEPTEDPSSAPQPAEEPTETTETGNTAPNPQGDDDTVEDDTANDDDAAEDDVDESPNAFEDETEASTLPSAGIGTGRNRPADYRPFLLVALGLAGAAYGLRRRTRTM